MSYAEKVIPIMRELRGILLPAWGKAQARYKTDQWGSVVTDADIQTELHTARRLNEMYPDIPFVGEENSGDRNTEQFWLMDPIDGTKLFVNGERECTSMLALIEKGRVRFSIIYDFLDDAMYWAEEGQGAFRDEVQLMVTSQKNLCDAKIIYEIDLEKGNNRKFMVELESRTHAVKSKVAGWEFVQVATGTVDARVCIDPFGYDYDFAPGALLVAEAGGTVCNIGSTEYDYRNTNFYAGSQHLAKYFSKLDIPITSAIDEAVQQ